jgi:hypothetical protein
LRASHDDETHAGNSDDRVEVLGLRLGWQCPRPLRGLKGEVQTMRGHECCPRFGHERGRRRPLGLGDRRRERIGHGRGEVLPLEVCPPRQWQTGPSELRYVVGPHDEPRRELTAAIPRSSFPRRPRSPSAKPSGHLSREMPDGFVSSTFPAKGKGS